MILTQRSGSDLIEIGRVRLHTTINAAMGEHNAVGVCCQTQMD